MACIPVSVPLKCIHVCYVSVSLGDGWAPEGNPIYKWAQYEKPPIPIGGATNPPTQGSVSVNMNAVTSHHEREPCEFTDMVKIIRLPLFGRIFLLKHVQGAIQASIVVSYWIYGSWSILSLLLLPHYREGHISVAPVLCKLQLVNALVVFCQWKGVFKGTRSFLCSASAPSSARRRRILGRSRFEKIQRSRYRPTVRVLRVWPSLLVTFLQCHFLFTELKNPQDQEFCFRCVQRRPPEAHHCSVCGQCVRKMDHHCPWFDQVPLKLTALPTSVHVAVYFQDQQLRGRGQPLSVRAARLVRLPHELVCARLSAGRLLVPSETGQSILYIFMHIYSSRFALITTNTSVLFITLRT